MGNTVTNYTSLVQALQDFPHRTSIVPYTDYFIGGAHERITNDIFVKNDGVGVKPMQQTLSLTIDPVTGHVAVPTGFLQWNEVRASVSGDWQDLVVKDAAWLYENYPVDAATGPPAYVATDTVASASITASVSGANLLVTAVASGFVTVGAPLVGTGIPANTIITGFVSGTSGGVGTYTINQSLSVSSESMTAGGDVFVFGPFPDQAYPLIGTYFGAAQVLSSGNATNWIVNTIPYTLLAACMIEACYFLKDAEQLQLWKGTYDEKLTSFCLAQKAMAFAAAMGAAVAPETAPIW